MSYALLFSGQANQHAAMLPWLESEPACAPLLQLMGQRLGADWRHALADEQRRSDNGFAQVLITGTALAAWAGLQARLPQRPAVVAGYSVGELAAFACAGVFSAEHALTLAAQRAALMDAAVRDVQTGLLSVSGLPDAAVLLACADQALACAIRISPSQAIYAGTEAALVQAARTLEGLGAVCTRLAVRVASHSPWMAPAADALATRLQALPFATPLCPLALNASGALTRQPAALRLGLSQQLAHTVQWSACMDAIAERQVRCVLEIGAGSALARMWNEHHPGIPARALDDFQTLAGAADWLTRQLDS